MKRIFLAILFLILIASPAWGTVFIDEDWDTGTPDACWPCKTTPCGTFNGWDGYCPSEYGGTDCVPQAGVTSALYNTAPNSFLQYKQTGTNDACNTEHSISGDPTTIYLRFYIYFTTDFNGTFSGDGLYHWIFTNSPLSNTGFRINIVNNSQLGECPSGKLCIVPEGDGGTEWWSTRAPCTGGGYWGTTEIDVINVKDLIGAWHALEYKMQISGSNVILTEWLDGVQTRQCTGPGQNSSAFESIYISGYSNTAIANNLRFYIDDIVVADAYIGPLGGGDTTDPVVSISTSDPSNITANSLSISGTASDAVGVTQCKYRIGSAPDGSNGTVITGTTSWSGTATGFSVGANTLYVGCTDAAANWGSDSIVVNYNPPPPVISAPLPSGTQGCSSHPQTVTLQVTTDVSATCKYHMADVGYDDMPNTFSNTTGTTSHTNPMSLGCGQSYVFYVRCMNSLGNKSISSTLISFDIRRGHGWHVQ